MVETLDELLNPEEKYHDYEYPKVSIIIPTYNNAPIISMTLQSILNQKYPDFEIVIVDAGSDDRTLEVIKGYRDTRIRIFSVSGFQRYEMLNKGISQSEGEYISFLFPGDYYISLETLKIMMEKALDNEKPHMLYCGTLLRNARTEPKILIRKFKLEELRLGHQPTGLQSCWFHTDTFKMIGKFNTSYNLRGGFDLMIRFCQNPKLKYVSILQILTDFDLRFVTRKMIIQHFFETFKTLYRYFGLFATIRWLFIQKDWLRLSRLWFRSLKIAFLGK